MRFLFWTLLLPRISWADDSPPPVELQLYTDQAATAAGASIQLLARLDVPEGWHIYWQNPGDSGQATHIELLSDLDLNPSGPRWTAPEERLVLEGDVINLAYTHQAAALFELHVPEDARGVLSLDVNVQYLICKHACAPGSIRTRLVLPIESKPHPSPQAARIARWTHRMPRPLPEGTQWEWVTEQLTLRIPEAVSGEFFPSEALENATEAVSWRPEDTQLSFILDLKADPPHSLTGSVLRISYADSTKMDYSLDIPPTNSR